MTKLKPVIIGIAGGSGSGKSTLAQWLSHCVGGESSVVVSQDDYYIDYHKQCFCDSGMINYDHPSALELELMVQHLTMLKAGQVVKIPQYDFQNHARSAYLQDISPKPLVIVDGLFILHPPDLRILFDFSVFLDIPEVVRFARRLKRDVSVRGRSPDDVNNQYILHVKPMHDLFVDPSKKYAGMVISDESSYQQVLDSIFTMLST